MRGEEGRTFPVLLMLLLRLSAWSEYRGSKFGIDPPVAYQLQNALVKYRFASSLASTSRQPSPSVAFPPFTTVPFSACMSAPAPVFVAFFPAASVWPGKSPSASPSCPLGTSANALCPPGGAGTGSEVRLRGSAASACSAMYWCGGHAFGASHCSPDSTNVVGNVPLYRFSTRLTEEKNPNAALALRRSSSGMMPAHRG